MAFDPTPRLGPFLRLSCSLTGVDSDLLRRCPPRDHSSVVTITLIMLAIFIWQTIAFSLTAHMLLDEMHRIRLELVAISALLAMVVMLVDSFTIIRSSWFLSGVVQLQRGGLTIPGALAARIKNGLQLLFRLPLAAVLAELAAVGFMLFSFSPEIGRRLAVDAIADNTAIAVRAATAYDATTARIATEIEQLRTAAGTAKTDAGSFRRDALQVQAEDPELKFAVELMQRKEKAKSEAERRLAQVPRRDEEGRRVATQRLNLRKVEFQAAQARVEKLRDDAEAAASRRRTAVQTRLTETQSSEARDQTRIDSLEKEHAARVAAREASIGAAIVRDPGYRPPDRGLLARVKVLAQLLDDSWVFTIAMLLHIGFFGIELGAVLCKVLTSVPSAYAAMLAGEEYANEVETANAVFARTSVPSAPEEAYAEPDDAIRNMAASDAEGDGAMGPETPSDGHATPDETRSSVARLEEGARRAQAQAAARAEARAKAAKSSETAPTPDSTAGAVLDAAARRGRGRPPGAKNRPKPDNDAGPHDGSSDAA